jgi:hypothetical protein
MKTFISLLLVALIASANLVRAADKAEPAAANVAGVWEFSVDTTAGSGNPTFTFKQEGERITGTYSGAFGTSPLVGSVIGNEIKFTFKVDGDGEKALVEYAGTVDGKTMKGTVKIGTLGEGTFSGHWVKKAE